MRQDRVRTTAIGYETGRRTPAQLENACTTVPPRSAQSDLFFNDIFVDENVATFSLHAPVHYAESPFKTCKYIYNRQKDKNSKGLKHTHTHKRLHDKLVFATWLYWSKVGIRFVICNSPSFYRRVHNLRLPIISGNRIRQNETNGLQPTYRNNRPREWRWVVVMGKLTYIKSVTITVSHTVIKTTVMNKVKRDSAIIKNNGANGKFCISMSSRKFVRIGK